ncbi:hypothetical protein TNCV_2187791 [Trichonephila clavipes]|nr:hypothetical protein TNCV_2187791 [Trichonephila clavipes]
MLLCITKGTGRNNDKKLDNDKGMNHCFGNVLGLVCVLCAHVTVNVNFEKGTSNGKAAKKVFRIQLRAQVVLALYVCSRSVRQGLLAFEVFCPKSGYGHRYLKRWHTEHTIGIQRCTQSAPFGEKSEDSSGQGLTATAGSDVVQSGRPIIFDDFFQHFWPYIGNNTANVVFQMVKRL